MLHRSEKRQLLSQFKADQKLFDKVFRQAKRQFENKSFKNLADLADKPQMILLKCGND